jgi:hypothetical protein
MSINVPFRGPDGAKDVDGMVFEFVATAAQPVMTHLSKENPMPASADHRRYSDLFQAFTLLFLVAAGCGGSPSTPAASTPPAASSGPTPTASAVPVVPPSVWSADMPKEQKAAFMKARVVPTMKPVFQSQNPTRYAEFACKTCHGLEFKDPKAFLPTLTVKDGKITAFAEKPELAKFMEERVVPNMASAMGMPPFDPKTGQGFGCHNCHAFEPPFREKVAR